MTTALALALVLMFGSAVSTSSVEAKQDPAALPTTPRYEGPRPWLDKSLPVPARVQALMARMTPLEKAWQLVHENLGEYGLDPSSKAVVEAIAGGGWGAVTIEGLDDGHLANCTIACRIAKHRRLQQVRPAPAPAPSCTALVHVHASPGPPLHTSPPVIHGTARHAAPCASSESLGSGLRLHTPATRRPTVRRPPPRDQRADGV